MHESPTSLIGENDNEKDREYGRGKRPLLFSADENGIVIALYSATGALEDDSETVAGSRVVSHGRRPTLPPKLKGGLLGGSIATLEFLLCYCEGTIVYALLATILNGEAVRRFPRSGPCSVEEGALDASICMLRRDWLSIIAMVLSILGMHVYLCLRYSSFFGIKAGRLGVSLIAKSGLSKTTTVTCLILLCGNLFQITAQKALGRTIFSLENLKEGVLGLSGVRVCEIVLLAPVREEILFRYFGLHIIRNRMTARSSVLCSGVLFGLVHLQNAWGSRFAPSYVAMQVGRRSFPSRVPLHRPCVCLLWLSRPFTHAYLLSMARAASSALCSVFTKERALQVMLSSLLGCYLSRYNLPFAFPAPPPSLLILLHPSPTLLSSLPFLSTLLRP